MAGHGPSPEPTAVKELNGTTSRRHNTAREPQYAPGIPDRPVSMSSGARKFWDHYVGVMAMSRVLTPVDGLSLAALCEDQELLKELRIGLQMQVSVMNGTLSAARKKFKEISAQAKKQGRSLSEEELKLGKKPPGNPMTVIAGSIDGRRRMATITSLSRLIMSREREFGLLPGR